MYAQVEKQKENKSKAVANSVAQKKSSVRQGFQFVDNRTDIYLQRRIQSKMGHSLKELIQKQIFQPKAVIQRIPRNTLAEQLGVDVSSLEGENYNILSDHEFVIRKIYDDAPQMRTALKSGFIKLSSGDDFKKFVGSLKLNYENILRGLGKSEGNIVHRDLSKENFPNTIEEVLSVIPKDAQVKVLIPIAGKAQVGVEYNWTTEGDVPIQIRMHSYELDRKRLGEVSSSHAAKGWIYRAIVGGETMDIHGNWHSIEDIVAPIPVEDPGDYTGTKPPIEANSVITLIDNIITQLVNSPEYLGNTNKVKEKMIKAEIGKKTEIQSTVPENKMRFVRNYILQKSKYEVDLKAFIQYRQELVQYETTMNNIHIPLI